MTMVAAKRLRGFTLIELMMTVTIIALLATVALPMAELSVQRQKEQELRTALRDIRNAIDAYRQAVDDGRIQSGSKSLSGCPPSLQILVDGVADARSPDGKEKIFFLRRIPRDPLFSDPLVSDDETWGKRSYASGPENPESGEDVFDVYTKAVGVGLNGIEYSRW